jgi:integrase
LLRPRIAEVRGSSPLGSTPKTNRFAGKTRRARDGAGMLWGFGAATVQQRVVRNPATLLLSENVNPKIVQEVLGHATISQSMDTYSRVLPDIQNGAVAAMESMIS